MNEIEEKMAILHDQLDGLLFRLKQFEKEFRKLQIDLESLKSKQEKSAEEPVDMTPPPQTISQTQKRAHEGAEERPGLVRHLFLKSNLEKFIGENLISKIGIAILVLGVGIGTKYAIDHQIISPLLRIILGYFLGAGLVGTSWYLKGKYHNFSAVLFAGAIAVFYLITLAAYLYFGLIPRWTAFILLLAVTISAVGAALLFNRQVIAHMGLVGAYAIPFLLDDGSGSFETLFSYILLINTGILAVSVWRYWKSLHYSSFIVTWLIILAWWIESSGSLKSPFPAGWFLLSFFILFYGMFILNKVLKELQFGIEDLLLLLANTALIIGFGLALLQTGEMKSLQGLFVLVIAAIHLAAFLFLFRKKQIDNTLVNFIAGLAITCFTLAIPVELDGNRVTAFWTIEAAALFFAGRWKRVPLLEYLAYPLVMLAFFSMMGDWFDVLARIRMAETGLTHIPLVNITFGLAMLLVFTLGFMVRMNLQDSGGSLQKSGIRKAADLMVPALLVITAYLALFFEIRYFTDIQYGMSKLPVGEAGAVAGTGHPDILRMGIIAVLVYSNIFFASLILLNHYLFKRMAAAFSFVLINIVIITLTLSFGLITLGELRESFLKVADTEYYHGGILIAVRYLVVLFCGFSLFSLLTGVRDISKKMDFNIEAEIVVATAILILLSNELINWLDLAGFENSYKLGLSILCGSYSLGLIIFGIFMKKTHHRILAMVLFGLTLIKLFVYDLTTLNTLSKTLIFILLGLLLLVMAYLYNKFAKRIFDEGSGEI
jgi:hypothetical protein